MFEFIKNWRKPKRSIWIFIITDEYLEWFHATSKRERVFTSGLSFDGLNKLEGWERWSPGTIRNGFITSFDKVEASIRKVLSTDGLENCYKHTVTVIFPKTINAEHVKFIVNTYKDHGFKYVNVYNPELEISVPSRRPMPVEERVAFIESLKQAEKVDDDTLCWQDVSYELLAKQDLHYSSLGCMSCGAETVEIDYAPGEIFPCARGIGRVHVCSDCLRQQRHKKIGRI